MPTSRNNPGVDWAILRNALIVLGGSVLLTGGGLYWSQQFRQRMLQQEQDQRQQFVRVEELYRETQEAANIIETSYPRFLQLQKQDFVADEQNYDWLNRLYPLTTQLKLPSLKYDIQSTAEYSIPSIKMAPNFHVYQTDFTLTLGLLHEGDLFRFLDTVERQKTLGLFSIRRCQLNRLQDKPGTNPKQANLSAQCSLTRYTVNIKPEKK